MCIKRNLIYEINGIHFVTQIQTMEMD